MEIFDWVEFEKDIREKHRILAKLEIQQSRLQAILAKSRLGNGVDADLTVWISHRQAAKEVGEEPRTVLRWMREANCELRQLSPRIWECNLDCWLKIKKNKGLG